ncbi:Fpg/Nei family DNA glycosylase [Microlunatus flavus]|uniref:Endonuclease 8 1 n=1 Tax=Microlunatus flavus TaxID=1036181 RepID=A0A1H9K008_9ACTN|nr:zinc finger domain-containing protein [Microlunatus flavus]SEQ92576.1 endonuclease-8 [Microlunatus flavus]
MPEGHTIHRLARLHKATFAGHEVAASSPQGRFADGAALIDGRTFEGTDAWGKHLFHRYSGDVYVHVHLGLYGKFAEGPLPAPEPRGALRLRIEGAGHYLDLRGATRCEIVTPAEKTEITAALGPDPLRPRTDPAPARERIGRSRVAIGALLMDQHVLAGIGNVYRAEILYRHGVNPYVLGRDLEPAVFDDMWADLTKLMQAGVRAGRIVTTEHEDRERRTGRATRADSFYVYRRTGEPCRRCDTPIAHAVMVARNLFWCPHCQPAV